MLKKFFVFSFLFLTLHCFSQDKIILISGNIIEGKVLSIAQDTIRFQSAKKEKITETFVESYRVFSIQYETGNEEVIYKYDSTTMNDRTEEELRNFIAGEQDALHGYKPTLASILSFGISGTAAFLLRGSFIIIAIPFVTYMAFVMLYKTSIHKKTVPDPQMLQTSDYIEGYMRIAKNRKNRNAFWGSIIGAGAGFAIYSLSQNSVF